MSNLEIRMEADSVTYTEGVQRVELLDYQDLVAWETAGFQFLTRPDVCDLPGPAGYDARWNNQLPNKTVVARVVDTEDGTLTLKTDIGYLGDRKTIEVSADETVNWPFSTNPAIGTKPFAFIIAVHAFDNQFKLATHIGGTMAFNIVNNQISLDTTNTGVNNCVYDTGAIAYNKDWIIIGMRDEGSVLHLFAKERGVVWHETTGAGAKTTNLNGNIAFGPGVTSTGYSATGRWGAQALAIGNAANPLGTLEDFIFAAGGPADYFVNYYSMG
jgi:hypothetical protein